MPYRLVTSRADHRDLASGFVLHSAPGHPAFPVRLAQELFLRAADHLPADRQLALWDPLCGSGYLATVLGLLYPARLRSVSCSDISAGAVALARRNLSLLSRDGLAARERELRERHAELGKPVHREAADAAARLARRWGDRPDLPTYAWIADALDPGALTAGVSVPAPDVVLTDVPYGEQTVWQSNGPPVDEPMTAFIRALCTSLPGHAVVVVTAQTRAIRFGTPVPALERLRLGHRAAFVGRVDAMRASL